MPLRGKTLILPLFSVAIGLVYLAVGLVGGQPGFAIAGAIVMFALAAVLVLVRKRSETVQGLLDRRDERINALDVQATAITGGVLLVAIATAFVVEIARGESGGPYVWLGCLGGVTYLVALVLLRLRR
jgi:hypothetical protein